MHLVKGVLKHTHLPHIFGRIRLLEHELNAEKREEKNVKIYTIKLTRLQVTYSTANGWKLNKKYSQRRN
jgi:hypothetical protein